MTARRDFTSLVTEAAERQLASGAKQDHAVVSGVLEVAVLTVLANDLRFARRSGGFWELAAMAESRESERVAQEQRHSEALAAATELEERRAGPGSGFRPETVVTTEPQPVAKVHPPPRRKAS